MEPALLLFPNLLGKIKNHSYFLPLSVDEAVSTIDGLIAESVQGGRSFLNRFRTKKRPHEMPIALLNEHSKRADLDFLLEPILKGERWGLVSDAGLPCIADPGAELVMRAKELNVAIQPFVGPSAILLSLMQSGLPGQRFSFHGYLSKQPEKRAQEIQALEMRSKKEGSTQIFIEAPYRNEHTFNALIGILHPKTLLCIAKDLTLPEETIFTLPISQWKLRAQQTALALKKVPAIFLVYGY